MKTVLTLAIAGILLIGYGIKSTWHSTPTNTSTLVDTIVYVNPSPLTATSYLKKTKKVENLTLTQNDTVFLVGEIAENAIQVAQEITKKSLTQEAVYLVINSPGGSVLDGALVVSAIQASKVPVYTICQSLCASMAAIIHQAGTKRYMVDRAILMFHDAAGGVQGTFPQIKDRFDFFSSYVNKMDNEIAARAGLTLPQFMAKLNPECWRDAEDALSEHFSDGYANLVFQGIAQSNDPEMSQRRNLKDKFEVQLGN